MKTKSTSTDNEKFINEFVVQIPNGYSEAVSLAIQMGFILDHKMIGFDDLFVFKHKTKKDNIHRFYQHRLKRSNKVNFIEQQIVKTRVKRASLPPSKFPQFNDRMYNQQWYLMRSSNNPEKFDMNVLEAWKLGYTGKGVVVTILDDGIDYTHPDLRDNYDKGASYDINGGDDDPMPNYRILDNRHGTRCAGEVAAKGNNTFCGVGVAFNAGIGAVRMLDGEVTDRVEAEALGLNQQYIHIYSGSWGPDDNGQKVDGPAKFAKAAIQRGVTSGRKGLGNIYVWASGNGGKMDDSCACDGYASSIFSLSVSSVTERNQRPWYLESCASTLISTYSSGNSNDGKIITTDLYKGCATDHTGTSASAPLAAGIIALLLEANPRLTWRDVQYITVVTANTQPFSPNDFITNAANRKVSNLYGFGLMDAGKMVRLGPLWQTLPPQHVCKNSSKTINRRLFGDFVETVYLDIDGCSGNNAVNYVEHVILHLTVEYGRRGDLQVTLISPSGTRSIILPYRYYDSHSGSSTFDKWPLMSVQFWGELCVGRWALEIRSKKGGTKMTGILRFFSLEVYGTDKSPMRLNPPSKTYDDNWFDQFERFVVPGTEKTIPNKDDHYTSYINSTDSSSGGNKIECHGQCFNNSCSGWGAQHCTSCKRYQNYNGFCVNECPSGTYLDTHNMSCSLCHISCDKCMGPGKENCSQCHFGDSFVHALNQCTMSLSACPIGYYQGHSNCTKCSNNCSVCTSGTKCSRCKDGFVLNLNNKCERSCDPGSYVDSQGKCWACHIDCLSCIDGSPNGCSTCPKDSYKLPIYENYTFGRCLHACPTSHFTNYSSGACYRCHQDCRTCTGPSFKSCTDCIPPKEMSKVDNYCIDPVTYKCKPDEFKTVNRTCHKCPANCKTCTEGRCTSCSTSKFVYNSSCVDKCPKDHFFLTKEKSCLKCSIFCDPCNTKQSLKECVQCLASNNVCEHHCNQSQYWSTEKGSCQSCHSSCSTCKGRGPHNCTKCLQPQYILSDGKCSNSCKDGEYAIASGSQKICIPCDLSCNNSLCNKENGKCEHCPFGHKLSLQGRCQRIITCPMSTFRAPNGTCIKCNDSCRSCRNSLQCRSCPKDNCLDPHSGICSPCCSLVWSFGNCQKCVAGREFCDLSVSTTFPSSLKIFEYSIFTFFWALILFLFPFLCIMALFYKNEILSAIRTSKYTKLTIEDDTSDSETVLMEISNGTYNLVSQEDRESYPAAASML